MNSQQYIEIENKFGARNYSPLDVVISRGDGIWVWDVDGKKYLDALSGYSALNQGHCHPKIVAAMVAQAQKLALTSRAFRNDRLPEFYRKVCAISGMPKVLPMNSGAEAVETALKAARKWAYTVKKISGDAEIIVCRNNFHGRTISIISFSSEPQYRDGFGPLTPGFKLIPYADADALEAAITPNTAAFLVEPIQGEGGIIIPKGGYLKRAEKICREHNVLFLLDEIQTGLGRTGKMFAFQHEGVTPDGIIVGKALSGGMYPVSAFLSNEEVMSVFHPGDHGSTFGGNPLAAAVACAALDVLVEEKLPRRSAELGAYFLEKIFAIDSPHVKEVRGKGLFIGVELKDSAGGARRFCERLKDLGILAKETHETVIRFAPPLIIQKEELDWALERIEKVLRMA